jgi:hypothetical protein
MAEQVEDVDAAGNLLGSWSDEAELVERAKTQPEAFGHLYDRYYSASSITSFAVPWMWRWPKS